VAGQERVLAFAETTDGGNVVATLRALYLPATYDVGRLPWDRVVHATWTAPELVVTVQPVTAGRPRTVRLELPGPGALPAVLRERVTASVVAERHVAWRGDAGARFAARRTEDGSIRWSVVLDPGLDPRDPEVRARADAELAALRSAWGV
jgi:hypothetical protein